MKGPTPRAPPQLGMLARMRLAHLHGTPLAETEEDRKLRAEGCTVIATRQVHIVIDARNGRTAK
jgi:hypothetical protein